MNDVSQEAQQDLVVASLKKAEGFAGTSEQEHYDECEEAVMGVLSQVRKVARQWKVSCLVLLRKIGLSWDKCRAS
jgi:centromere/kinetochore protein ZW10